MKGKFKKALAVFLTAVMAVTALGITAGADSIEDKAIKLTNGKSATFHLDGDFYGNENADFRVDIKEAGDLKFTIKTALSSFTVHFYDQNGKELSLKSDTVTVGSKGYDKGDYHRDKNFEKFEGKLTYSVKKGTYYLRITKWQLTDCQDVTVKASFPSSSSSSSSKSAYISIAFKKGSTVYLGAAFPTSSSVTWSSSNKSVATVDKFGTVTTKKAGTTIITAKSGSYKAQIQIEVV